MATEIKSASPEPTGLAVPAGDLLKAWLDGRNERTRRGYLSDLGDFARWRKLKSAAAAVEGLLRMPPGDANRTVLGYKASQIDRGLSSSTINRRLAALRSMVKVGRTIGLIGWSLEVENVPTEARGDMRGPGLVDLQKIDRYARARSDPEAARDRALFVMLFDLGLRRNELCSLEMADVETGTDGLPAAVRVVGKGKREKVRITLPPGTARALADWLEVRGDGEGPLFPFTGEWVRIIIDRLARAAGVARPVRPHGLRHAAITAALNSGKDVRVVQRFSRHKTLDMVLRYDDERGDLAGEVAGLLSRRREED